MNKMKTIDAFYDFLDTWGKENKLMVASKVKNYLIRKGKLNENIDAIIEMYMKESYTYIVE